MVTKMGQKSRPHPPSPCCHHFMIKCPCPPLWGLSSGCTEQYHASLAPSMQAARADAGRAEQVARSIAWELDSQRRASEDALGELAAQNGALKHQLGVSGCGD